MRYTGIQVYKLYRYTGVQGYRHTGIQGYNFQDIFSYVSKSVRGYTGMPGCSNRHVKIYVQTGIQVYRFTGIQVYSYTGVQVYRRRGIQVNRYTGVQVYRYNEGIQVYKRTPACVQQPVSCGPCPALSGGPCPACPAACVWRRASGGRRLVTGIPCPAARVRWPPSGGSRLEVPCPAVSDGPSCLCAWHQGLERNTTVDRHASPACLHDKHDIDFQHGLLSTAVNFHRRSV